MVKNNQTIGIIGAMDAELEEYTKYITDCEKKYWNDFLFQKGRLFNKKVIIVKSGVGKVFASMVCQKLIDEYGPNLIIFTGVAGALNKQLEIGDVVISKDCINHDMDGRALGFSRGTIPYTDYKIFVADDRLKKLALSAKLDGHNIIEGRNLTGDQFLTKKKIKEYQYLTDELKGDSIDMEGAAIAQVCTLNKVPFLIVKTISDKADGTAVKDFNKFLPIAAKNSFNVVRTILQNL